MLGIEVIAGSSVLVHDLQDHGAGRGASMGDSRLSGMVVVVVHACFLLVEKSACVFGWDLSAFIYCSYSYFLRIKFKYVWLYTLYLL